MKSKHLKNSGYIPPSNVQETQELAYFQTIQVQKQEIASLKIQLGQAQAEIDHLNHQLKSGNKQGNKAYNCGYRAKYEDLMLELIRVKQDK